MGDDDSDRRRNEIVNRPFFDDVWKRRPPMLDITREVRAFRLTRHPIFALVPILDLAVWFVGLNALSLRGLHPVPFRRS